MSTTERLIEALKEAGLSQEKVQELLHQDVRVQLDSTTLGNLRREANKPASHSYPEGVYGAPCSICGTREGWKEGCIPNRQVQVDRETFLALVDIAEEAMLSPWRKLAKRLAEALSRYTAKDHHCGCDAQDADVCPAHRALDSYGRLVRSMKDEERK